MLQRKGSRFLHYLRRPSVVVVAWLTLVLIPLSLATPTHVASASLAKSLPFPCKLDHGCRCNHSAITRNVFDNQYYGSCTSCSSGWTGPFCDEIDVPCMNGGELLDPSNPSAPCVCPPAWSGTRCEGMMCPNSIGGQGTSSVAPPDPATHACDSCRPGWSGVNCAACLVDAACSEEGDVCDTSLLVRGSTKHLECQIQGAFLKLLGSGVEAGRVTMDCSSEGPDVAFATHSTGSCVVSLFRVEANASYTDPFFFCTAQNCSLRVDSERGASTANINESWWFASVRSLGQALVLVLCATLACVGQFSSLWNKRTLGRVAGILAVVLVLTLAGYIVIVTALMNQQDTSSKDVVTYQCEAAHCVCAPDPPPQYTPICSTSAFGMSVLPIIRHGMEVKCDTGSSSCVFTPRDVETSVPLVCSASECVSPAVFPYEPSIAGATTSVTQIQQSKTLLWAGIGILQLVIGAAALVIRLSLWRLNNHAVEFQQLFLLRGDRRSPRGQPQRRGGSSSHGRSDSELQTVDDCGTSPRSSTSLSSSPSSASSGEEASSVATAEEGVGVGGDGREETATLHAALPPRHNTSVFPHREYAPIPVNDADDDASIAHAVTAALADERDVSTDNDERGSELTARPHTRVGVFQLSLRHRKEIRKCMSSHSVLEVRGLGYALPKPRLDQWLASAMPQPVAKLLKLGDWRRSDGGGAEDDREESRDFQQILSNVTCSISSGEVLALMGPSGAGKTTLLDILAIRTKAGRCEGRIEFDGVPIVDNNRVAQYRSMIGYVSQEDTLLPALTVRETIHFAARLKLPAPFSDATVEFIVDDVIRALRLERCANTLVGDGDHIRGVSGGERRRVSIAVELVANPRILFLDEPTSGLDALSAKHVMSAVVHLAKAPKMRQHAPHYFAFQPIVVCSIHQPSIEIFDLFDKVMLLSRGVAVYCGPATEAVPYLSRRLQSAHEEREEPAVLPSSSTSAAASPGQACNLPGDGEGNRGTAPDGRHHTNPAEVLMHLEDAISDSMRAALQSERLLMEYRDAQDVSAATRLRGSHILHLSVALRRYYPNWWSQFTLLVRRSTASLLGSFHLVVCHALVTFVVGSLMCILYRQEGLDLPGALNRAGSVTFLLLVVAFVSLSVLDQLISERKLLVVERENRYYTTLPYLLSKLVVDVLPLRIVPVVLLGAVIYFPMGLRTDSGEYFLWFLFLLSLFSTCMTLMTLAVGVLMKTFGGSALTAAVLILWNFVFGGLLVQADTIPPILAPFRRVSPFFLTFEALLVNELNGQMCTFAPTDATGKPSATSIPLFCVQYLENLGLHPNRFADDVILLGAICGLLLVLVWVLLDRTGIQR